MFSDLGFARGGGLMITVVLTLYTPMSNPALAAEITSKVSPSPSEIQMAELWQQPDDLASRDLFYGPWGEALAPDAHAAYMFVRKKRQGASERRP